MTTTLRLGLAGPGNIGLRHLALARQSTCCDVVAVADPGPGVAAALAGASEVIACDIDPLALQATLVDFALAELVRQHRESFPPPRETRWSLEEVR